MSVIVKFIAVVITFLKLDKV